MTLLGLRGPSAENLVALGEQVRGAGSAASGADLGRLAEDLFGAAAVLRAEPALRRVATDQSVDAAAKAGLVREVFGNGLSAEGLDLVAAAAQRRWTATRDLPDVLEHLGVVAVVRSTGDDAGRLSDELFTVGETVNGDTELRAALSDPARSEADKAALVSGLLEGKALPATIRLARLALNGTHRTVSVALAEYQKVAAEVQGEGVARVRSARELSAAEQERLAAGLSAQYGRTIRLNVVVEPGLVGGLRVEIGDDVIDGSVSARLDDTRRRLAG